MTSMNFLASHHILSLLKFIPLNVSFKIDKCIILGLTFILFLKIRSLKKA